MNHKYRRGLKWLGVVVIVVLIASWLASGICYCGYAGRTARIELIDGRIQFWQGMPDLTSPHWYAGTNPKFRFINQAVFQGRLTSPWNANAVLVPIWYFAIVAVVPTMILWMQEISAQRRLQLGICRHCKFDMTGLRLGSVCPECGKAPAQ